MMPNKQANKLLSYVLKNNSQIDHAVQMAFINWRKNLLIEQFAQLMQAAGISIDNATKKELRTCDSIADLTESLKELFVDLVTTAFKHFKTSSYYLEFMYVMEQSLEDWLRKHKEKIVGEIVVREKAFKEKREKDLKTKVENRIVSKKRAASEKANEAELLLKTLPVLALFISVADALHSVVIRSIDFTPQLVKLDKEHGIFIIDKHLLVYNLESLHEVKNGSTSHLAISNEDGVPEVKILQLQWGYINKSVYLIVNNAYVEGLEAETILQDKEGHIFALVEETSKKANEDLENLVLVPKEQFLIPLVQEGESYVPYGEKIPLSVPLVEVDKKFVRIEFISQPHGVDNKDEYKKPKVLPLMLPRNDVNEVFNYSGALPAGAYIEQRKETSKAPPPMLPRNDVKNEVFNYSGALPAGAYIEQRKETSKAPRKRAQNELSKDVPEQLAPKNSKADTDAIKAAIKVLQDKIINTPVSTLVYEIRNPNLQPDISMIGIEAGKLSDILATAQMESEKTFNLKRKPSVKNIPGSRVLQMVLKYEEMIDKKNEEAENNKRLRSQTIRPPSGSI